VTGEKGRIALKAQHTGRSDLSETEKLAELSRHVQRTICEAQRVIHSDLTVRMLEAKKASLKRSPSMKVSELSSRIEKFRNALIEHADLWKQSLDHVLPDYPIANGAKLREQLDSLARQLGGLRPYIDKFDLPSMMGVAGVEWDVYDSSVSNDVAARKGHSIEGVLQQLQQILGRLDSMSPESDFELHKETRPAPQHVTIHQHGPQSRVNLNSTDQSQNFLSTTEQNIFSQVRAALESGVTQEATLRNILAKLTDFETTAHQPTSLEKFQAFVNSTASYMTIVGPFIPALLQMVGK